MHHLDHYKEFIVHGDPSRSRKPPLHNGKGERPRFRVRSGALVRTLVEWPLLWLAGRVLHRMNPSRTVRFGYLLVTTIWWRAVLRPWLAGGVIRHIKLSWPFCDEPPLFHVSFELHPPKARTDGALVEHTYTRARGQSLSAAMSRTIGEVVERYPWSIWRESGFLHRSHAELLASGRDCLDLASLDFLPEFTGNRAKLRADPKHRIAWTTARRIVGRKTIESHLPASFIHWNRDSQCDGGLLLKETSTHGGAAYPTVEGALIRALLEWYGRDGFFHHWCLGLSPLRLSIDSIRLLGHRDLDALLGETRALGCYDVHFLDVTSPKTPVPSIACVLVDKRDSSACRYAVGAGCDLDPGAACHAAMLEAWGVRQWLVNHFDGKRPFVGKPVRLWGDHERLTWHASGESHAAMRRFLSGEERPATDAMARHTVLAAGASERTRLDCLCMLAEGHDDMAIWYALRTETPGFDHLGLASVRTFVSGLIPPFQNMAMMPRQCLHRRAAAIGRTHVNDIPHPYP